MTARDSDPDVHVEATAPASLSDDRFAALTAATATLSELLVNAWRPGEIEGGRHERLLARALDDPFAAASADELRESERLREALAGRGDHPHLGLARGLANAYRPNLLPATASRSGSKARLVTPRNASSKRRASGVAVFTLATAALVLIGVGRLGRRVPSSPLPAPTLLAARTTSELFRTTSPGSASERVDRIASARERDLRENRYALWGVR